MPNSLADKDAAPHKPIYSPAQARLMLLTLSLVGLATWGLYALQNALQIHDHTRALRPFSIGYLIPLFVVTTLGGKRFGRGALALSLLLAIYVLTPPHFSFGVLQLRYWVELGLLLVVGEMLIRSVDAIRRDMALREDVEQSPFTTSLVAQVKDAASHVPGVEGIGHCTLRRRGIEYFLDMDIFVDGSLPLRDADRVAAGVAEAGHGVYRLVCDVRVRLRPID